MRLPFAFALASAVLGLAPSALAATYQVGPGKTYATIQDTLDKLHPGDLVEVDGDHTYPGDIWFRTAGTKDKPITIRGIKKNGRRPVIEGIGTEQWHDMIVLFYANNLVFESFEIVGDDNPDHFGLVNKADNVVLRDLVVHGVRGQGLLGTDSESGSLTLESSEFYGNGDGLYNHQIYAATDESMYPGSVFRMQYCYIHDGTGGNNVKSRAERNEIYFNWIEGAVYHELDLIGPDGQDENLAREDSDVVGNVLVKHSEWRIARIGGDGTGNTAGRYRFVNNTMVLGPESDVAIGLQQTVASVEMHNNVIVRTGKTGGEVWNHAEPEGPAPVFAGSHNWIQKGFAEIPGTFTDTISGADAAFADMAGSDFRPSEGSPLLDKGTTDTAVANPAFPNPMMAAESVPPARALGTDGKRPSDATPDIGAFELGSGSDPGQGGPGPSGSSGSGGTGGGDGFKNDDTGGDDGGCGCRVAPPASTPWALALLLGAVLGRRRRAKS